MRCCYDSKHLRLTRSVYHDEVDDLYQPAACTAYDFMNQCRKSEHRTLSIKTGSDENNGLRKLWPESERREPNGANGPEVDGLPTIDR